MIRWIKILPIAATFGKGCHIRYAVFYAGQKISVIKFSPMIADGKIGEISTKQYNFPALYLHCHIII